MSSLVFFSQSIKTITLLVVGSWFFSSNSYAFDKRRSNTIMMENGKTLSKFGNGLKDSDGTLYMKYGNAIKDSNGEIWQLYGNNSIRRKSDGKTCFIFGNSIKCD